jgi:hypothetical protein
MEHEHELVDMWVLQFETLYITFFVKVIVRVFHDKDNEGIT